MKKEIIVYKLSEKQESLKKHSKAKTWSVYNHPRTTATEYLESLDLDIDELFLLNSDDRLIKAKEFIKKQNNSIVTAIATITALEPVNNKTKIELFECCNYFDFEGETVLYGKRNQSLRIKIELQNIEFNPDIVNWEKEKPFQFVNENLGLKTVVSSGVTPYGNSCVAIAVGCELKDNILLVGTGAKFYHNGKKKVDFDYYFNFNKNHGTNVILPEDMDYLNFSFFYYQWYKDIEEGNYIKKDTVFVAKTENNNHVVFQNNPRRALVVLQNGEVLKNDIASFGNASIFTTKYFNLDDYKLAIQEFEKDFSEKQKKAETKKQALLDELYQNNKGWYIIELPCFKEDLRRGGHKKQFTNWKILAESKMDAYNKAVQLADEKKYFWFAEAVNCQIEFYGVWTDEKEELLKEQGLI